MHRIDTSDNTNILPEPTAPGPKPNGYFRKPNAIEGIKGTILDTEWVNMVQEELCNAVLASGAALAKNSRSQLADAMRSLSLTKFAVISGINVYACSVPGLISYFPGLTINALVGSTNTTASSLNINNLAAVPIGTTLGNALQPFDMAAGSICQLVFNGSIFQLLNPSKWQASAKLTAAGGTFTNPGTFAVPFSAVEYSSPNIAVNPGGGIIQAVVPGLYEAKANLGFTNLDVSTQVIAEIHRNGIAVASTGMPETALATQSRSLSVPIHTELYMNAGDYVRLIAAIPSSRQNLGVDGGGNRTFLSLRRVQT